VAFSQAVDHHHFQAVKAADGHVDGDVAAWRDAAAEQAAVITESLLALEPKVGVVENVNFPAQTDEQTPIEETQLALVTLGSLFAADGDGYQFAFPTEQERIFCPDNADVQCLRRGHISHTRLDYQALGRI
jgi:broad specificity polyphosphatase/5'/3'-nucleotidase SurE